MLDVQLGMLGHASTTGQCWTEDWEAVAGEPGGAARLCATGVKSMPPDLAATATELLDEARRLRAERNQFAHAVLVMDPEWTGDSAPWLLKDPKGGELALLDPDRGAALTADANRLEQQAAAARAELQARGLCRPRRDAA